MTLTDAIHKTLQNLMEVQKRSPRTLTNYRRTLQQYAAHVVQVRGLNDDIQNFTSDTVESFVGALGAAGRGGNTILNKLHGLAALKKWCRSKKDGRGRPCLVGDPLDRDAFERPKQTKPAVKFLYPAELEKFMKCPVTPELDLARALVVDTMIRRLEVCEALVGDLEQVGDSICLNLAVKGRRTPGEGKVKIDLSAPFAERLVAYLKERRAEAHEPLLRNRQGVAWTESQLTCAFIRIGVRAGIRRLSTAPHTIRHTVATINAADGVDRVTLAAMLNHRGLNHVDKYTHLIPGKTAEARARQGAAIDAYLRSGPDSSLSFLSLDPHQPSVKPAESQ